MTSVGVALEQGEARKVIGLPLKLVGNFWCQSLLAVLKQPKDFSVRGQFMMTSFMELKKGLFRFSNRIVYVNDALIRVIEAENFRDRRFQLVSNVGSLAPKIGQDASGIEEAGWRNLDVGDRKEVVNRGWERAPGIGAVEELPGSFLDRPQVFCG